MAWTLNRNEMIEMAYNLIGVVSVGNSVNAEQYAKGSDAINMAIEDLHNNNIALLQISEDSVSTTTSSNAMDADVEDVIKVWVESSSNNHEPFMRFLTYSEYYNIADKETTGTPYECYVEYSNPRKLILWPAPSGATTVKFLKVTKISSLDSASSTVEFEKRYYGALVYKTAEILADMFNIHVSEKGWIRSQAKLKMKAAEGREIRSQTSNTMKGSY